MFDGLAKSPKLPIFVIPAKAGIQEYQLLLDPGLRRGDGLGDFLRMCHVCLISKRFPSSSLTKVIVDSPFGTCTNLTFKL
jgi:hypothetical protein